MRMDIGSEQRNTGRQKVRRCEGASGAKLQTTCEVAGRGAGRRFARLAGRTTRGARSMITADGGTASARQLQELECAHSRGGALDQMKGPSASRRRR